jgi:ACR3 family arsenite efflux pump ArsB
MRMRAMAAQVTGRCSFAAMILAARWIRERMIGTWMERCCHPAIPHLHFVGFLCLGVLILARWRGPKIIHSPNSVTQETVT